MYLRQWNQYIDEQWYIDISFTPLPKKIKIQIMLCMGSDYPVEKYRDYKNRTKNLNKK